MDQIDYIWPYSKYWVMTVSKKSQLVPLTIKITKRQKIAWRDFADGLHAEGKEGQGNVKAMIVDAVAEYRCNISLLCPDIRTRLLLFAQKCCNGRVNTAIEVMLNEVATPKTSAPLPAK